jgi:glutamate dehydrogenase
MTDEVASLVLDDNYQQNVALSNAALAAPAQLHVQADWLRKLEKLKLLDRKLESLPSPKQFRERSAQGRILATPELAVLLAYTKIAVADELLGSALADDPYLQTVLADYFPSAIRERFAAGMHSHPLRREIITSQVVNQMINIAGIGYYPRLSLETGAPAEQLARAHIVAREIYGVDQALDKVRGLDNKIDANVQVRMRLDARTLAERASRWLVQNRRRPIDITATIDFFAERMQRLIRALPEVLIGREQALFEGRREAFIAAGVPTDLAVTVAAFPAAYAGLGIAETAARVGADVLDVARVHIILSERLELGRLLDRILALPQQDRWQTTARATLCDDLYSVHAQLTRDVLAVGPVRTDAVDRVAAWEQRDPGLVSRTSATIAEIVGRDTSDLAGLSVALRLVRRLLRTTRDA